MDARRRLAATSFGAVVVVLGALAWALAATSMAAVQAAEARALGPGHTADMPGEDELALVAHDARLAGMLVVAAGLGLLLAGHSHRRTVPVWLGAVLALVVANATLGRAVDAGPVLPAAAGLLLASGAGVAVALVVAARRAGGQAAAAAPARTGAGSWWPLVVAGALGAGTLPVLQFQGTTSQRYAEWVPPALVTATLVTAVGLLLAVAAAALLMARGALALAVGAVLSVAAAAVLLERHGGFWQVRDELWSSGLALVLASAPLVLCAAASRARPRRAVAVAVAVAAVTLAGVLLAAAPNLLVVPLLTGGFLGLLLTGPAGAYVNYDGLPVVGGGLVLAALVAGVLLAVRRAGTGRPTATVDRT